MKKYLGFLFVVALVTVMFAGCISSQPTQTVFPPQTPTPVVAITNTEIINLGDVSHSTFRQEITRDGNNSTFRFIPLVNVTGPLIVTYQMQEKGEAFISDKKIYNSVTSDNPVEIVVKQPSKLFSMSVVISDKEGHIIYTGGGGGGPGDGPGSGGGGIGSDYVGTYTTLPPQTFAPRAGGGGEAEILTLNPNGTFFFTSQGWGGPANISDWKDYTTISNGVTTQYTLGEVTVSGNYSVDGITITINDGLSTQFTISGNELTSGGRVFVKVS
jgi:hypothetical protein